MSFMEWLSGFSPAVAVVIECAVILIVYFNAPKKPFMLYLLGILTVYTGVSCLLLRETPLAALERIFPMMGLTESSVSDGIYMLALMFLAPAVMCFCDDEGIPYSCSIAQCFGYVLFTVLYHIGLLNRETGLIMMSLVLAAPVAMIGCYLCMLFIAVSPEPSKPRRAAEHRQEERQPVKDYDSHRGYYWDDKRGYVHVRITTDKEGFTKVTMENGDQEEVSEISEGSYQGYHSGLVYHKLD